MVKIKYELSQHIFIQILLYLRLKSIVLIIKNIFKSLNLISKNNISYIHTYTATNWLLILHL